jgi:hypothetical protein
VELKKLEGVKYEEKNALNVTTTKEFGKMG